ncbi:winged helix-turn-helix transcriptional regulator, partial [Halorubrum rutilum]
REFVSSDDPVLSSPEIAEEFGFTSSGIYKRLQDLESRGLVESKKVGQGRAWWITPKGRAMIEQ